MIFQKFIPQHLKILNSKEKKEIVSMINSQWDANFSTDLGMLRNNEDKIFLINPSIANIDFSKLRINSLGLYIAEVKDGFVRLSIEGSQLIGPHAKTNVVDLTHEEAGKWLMGEDIERQTDFQKFVIMRSGVDFLGCGCQVKGKILNYVGKNRRVSAVHS
ncbi:MAG TPA: hypothetical protein VJB12_05540 [Candidatus Nanoarchaeia archaeon]|nr:hypothetical protein [Candidatus Nanoarchaeia archaeon]